MPGIVNRAVLPDMGRMNARSCLGRRSWLFADSVAGARASARLYSLVQCAKANGFEPYAYLRRVFTELPRAQSLGDVEALLPTRLTPADLT